MVLDSVKKFCPKALLPFLAIVFIYSFAGAQEARFFDEIRDVPIPPGFEELAGEGYSYDKPQGRIVEAVAGGPAVSRAESKISEYYAVTLPQFGWQRIAPDSYRRDNEILTIEIEKTEQRIILSIMVSPA